MYTHWLQNPNKNYLGHWDLPHGKDAVLTINKASWEEVQNPTLKKVEMKRVIRFVENYKWVKPFICNETNARTIFEANKKPNMEDCSGMKIKIGASRTKVMGKEVDCLRVRNVNHNELDTKPISKDQVEELKMILAQVENKTESDICNAFNVSSLDQIPEQNFGKIISRLKELSNG